MGYGSVVGSGVGVGGGGGGGGVDGGGQCSSDRRHKSQFNSEYD